MQPREKDSDGKSDKEPFSIFHRFSLLERSVLMSRGGCAPPQADFFSSADTRLDTPEGRKVYDFAVNGKISPGPRENVSLQ
jgi:hypothetical protein